KGAHDLCRTLGPQRQAPPGAILERIHLLFHDVGGFPDATGKDFRMLEEREAYLPVTVPFTRLPHNSLQVLPAAHGIRQDVVRPSRREQFQTDAFPSCLMSCDEASQRSAGAERRQTKGANPPSEQEGMRPGTVRGYGRPWAGCLTPCSPAAPLLIRRRLV